MVRLWSVCGPSVVRLWSVFGPSVVRLWPVCGPAVVRPWSGAIRSLVGPSDAPLTRPPARPPARPAARPPRPVAVGDVTVGTWSHAPALHGRGRRGGGRHGGDVVARPGSSRWGTSRWGTWSAADVARSMIDQDTAGQTPIGVTKSCAVARCYLFKRANCHESQSSNFTYV